MFYTLATLLKTVLWKVSNVCKRQTSSPDYFEANSRYFIVSYTNTLYVSLTDKIFKKVDY